MSESLAVRLYGMEVATVAERREGRLRLEYTVPARNEFPAGTPLLSLSLPLTTEAYSNNVTRCFLDGLLPEGDVRRALADDFAVRADDTFALIAALGRDCAGALAIQPESDPPPPPASVITAEPLTDGQVAELIGNLRTAPLGAGGRVRISLAGVQEKLLLTRLPDGAWGRPVDGTPSTHILKPPIRGYTQTVQNEAFCMRLAQLLGLRTAEVEIATFNGYEVLVVSRYDRLVRSSGEVERVHQEDFCQALVLPPRQKYQQDGGPSLRRIAQILRAVHPESITDLLRAVTLNAVVGNGDAHGKNFSLMHERSGALRLAPLYDVMSTLLYGDDRLAMYIDNVHQTRRVTAARIVNEAVGWGMARADAQAIVGDLLTAVPRAADDAASEIPGVSDDLRALITSQAKLLLTA
jgi:serine/threonine-protein kinase HipA